LSFKFSKNTEQKKSSENETYWMVSWDSLHMRLCCMTRPVIWAQTPCRPAAWSACTPSSSTRRPGPLLPSSPMFLQPKQKKGKNPGNENKISKFGGFFFYSVWQIFQMLFIQIFSS
jgi:hypothetical protein